MVPDKVERLKVLLMTNKQFRFYLVCSLFMASLNMPVHAALYTDVSVEYQNLKIEGQKLHPLSARIKLGAPLSREMGIEASYAGSINDDEALSHS